MPCIGLFYLFKCAIQFYIPIIVQEKNQGIIGEGSELLNQNDFLFHFSDQSFWSYLFDLKTLNALYEIKTSNLFLAATYKICFYELQINRSIF